MTITAPTPANRRAIPRLAGAAFGLLFLGLLLLGMGGNAQAQTAICRQISTELAAIGSGNTAAYQQQQALGQRRQLAQVQASMAQLGCGQGGLISPAAIAQCRGLNQQGLAISASIAQIESGGRIAGNDRRRAQLQAAWDANACRNGGRVETARAPVEQARPQPRGLLETLFGATQATPAVQPAPGYVTETLSLKAFESLEEEARRKGLEAQRRAKLDEERGGRPGSGLPVCVRTCDGFFFPVNYQVANSNYSALCEASCPGARAELYWLPQGADIATAVSARGASYTALPAAFAYRTARNAACSCKSEGQSWGRALQSAEALIRRRGDMVVTPESSQKLAQPELPTELRGTRVSGLAGSAPLVTGSVNRKTQSIDPQKETPPEPEAAPAAPPFETVD